MELWSLLASIGGCVLAASNCAELAAVSQKYYLKELNVTSIFCPLLSEEFVGSDACFEEAQVQDIQDNMDWSSYALCVR